METFAALMTHTPEIPPPRLVGVRLRETAKAEDYLIEDPELSLHVGEFCIVESPSGHATGEVRRPVHPFPAGRNPDTYPHVVRAAAGHEAAQWKRTREKERQAIQTCALRAKGRNLPMKIMDVEMTAEGRRVTVYFTAEGRVDFRELVKELAREFRARIEMRQVGARDAARVFGGCGPCGRALCCSSHLRRFEPISVKMAKAQDVPLNDTRLLGDCGRLKCCLLYEFSTYEAVRHLMPKIGSACSAEKCDGGGRIQGRVKGIRVLKESVLVHFDDGIESEVPLSDLTWEGRSHVR